MNKYARWVFVVCVGAAIALAPPARGAVKSKQQQSQSWAAVKAAKTAEGWIEVAPQVLERRLGTRVEHLGYGQQGLAWSLGELQQRLEFLKGEQENYPSADLDRTIAELTDMLARTRQTLLTRPDSNAAATSASGPSCTSICYSASGDAWPLTATQGVGAVASASFNSACGFSGDTYAYAYARATLGATTTVVAQTDGPKSGNPVSSYASASVNGGSVTGVPCYSESSAYAQSSALGIYYSQYDSNSSCPPVSNPTVTISGTTWESFTTFTCRSRTWTSTVSGGTGPYSYQWLRGTTVVGTASSYTGNVCAVDDPGFTLTLNVSDSAGRIGTDTHNVGVAAPDPDPGGGTCFVGPGEVYQCP